MLSSYLSYIFPSILINVDTVSICLSVGFLLPPQCFCLIVSVTTSTNIIMIYINITSDIPILRAIIIALLFYFTIIILCLLVNWCFII